MHALSSRMTPRRAQDAWIREAEPLVRQYRAVAVLSVTAFTTMVIDLDVGSIAKGLLKGDGFELTRANELIQLPGAPLRTIPGDALATIPNVASLSDMHALQDVRTILLARVGGLFFHVTPWRSKKRHSEPMLKRWPRSASRA